MTEEKLDEFHSEYRGSAGERRDLLAEFTKRQGNMAIVFEFVMCSEPDADSHRFMDLIDEAIGAGAVETGEKYEKWRKATAKKRRPAEPLKPRKAAKHGRDAGADDAALVAAIQSRVRSAPMPELPPFRAGRLPASCWELYAAKGETFLIATSCIRHGPARRT